MLKRTLLLGGEKYLKPDGDSLAWHERNDNSLNFFWQHLKFFVFD